jgi:tRNA pseudouridine38-40 synthase
MKPYKIVVAYDGTNYHGWQEQKGPVTIAGILQASFKKLYGHEIKVVGASRTDTGVHALDQVARFYTDRDIDCSVMLRSWNGALPCDIVIRSLELSPESFHPQHNIAEKTYCYYFALEQPLPFMARHVHYFSYSIDFDLMQKCLQLFVGEHDFFAFSTGDCNKSTICTVNSITVEFDTVHRVYCIQVKGKRFLHHMVRRIVGAAFRVSSSRRNLLDEVSLALQKREVKSFLPTAPACGLVLKKIMYKN